MEKVAERVAQKEITQDALIESLRNEIHALRSILKRTDEYNNELTAQLKKLETENDDFKKAFGPILQEVPLSRLNKIAETLGLNDPLEVTIPKYIPSQLKTILQLPISPRKIVEIAERNEMSKKAFFVKRIKRLIKTQKKHQTTVFFSILGIIKFAELYHWDKNNREAFAKTWDSLKASLLDLVDA